MDTFVLRIWTPADGAGGSAHTQTGTRGTAHHVGTGRSGVFRSDEQLVELIAALRKQSVEDRGSVATAPSFGEPADALDEGAVR